MMFRARIGLAAAAVIALLTSLAVVSLSGSLGRETEATLTARVENAQRAFPSLDRLRGIDLLTDTSRLARQDELGEVFAKASVDEQRQAAFVAVQAGNARLEQAGRKADLVAVVGAGGRVVSRDLNINAMYDEDLKSKYPAVATALDGVANKDVWNLDGHLYHVGVAPIRSRAGTVVGALIVGHVASAKDAATDRERLGSEVAYFLDGKVHASSFKKEGAESAEEKDLAGQLFDGLKLAEGALAGEAPRPVRVRLGAEEYLAATGPLSGNGSKSRSGFVVLASISAARAPIAGAQSLVLLLGGAALLVAVGATVLTATRFIRPLDHLESGVAEVINGNHDYVFESPGQDYEGLANGLNVMVARLLGRPDPTDDDDAPGPSSPRSWQGDVAVDENLNTGSHPTFENAQLAAEPEADYLRRVFQEFQSARRQTGESVEGMTLEGFTAKLRQNEDVLKKKYGCRLVRFRVVVKNNQTTLKPIPLN